SPAERQEENATLALFFAIVSGLVGPLIVKPFVSPSVYFSVQAALAVLTVGLTILAWRMFSPDMRTTLSRLFGVFGLIALWWVAYEHNDSIWVFFARDYMSHAETAFTVPDWLPGWLGGGTRYEPKADAYQFINSLFVLIFIPLFNVGFRLVDPEAKRFTAVRRVLIGFFVSAAAPGLMMVAAQRTQGGTALVSAYWMVAAYIVLTAGEVLVYGTMLDLSYSAAPKSMKGFITACFLLTNTLGNLINSVLSRLYGGSLKDTAETRGPLGPVEFFALSMGIVIVSGVAFYFVGKRFERSRTEAAARVT
ncbi:MAG TPA: hypothetical protein VH120_21785, partial [Gemmataceae bacterium]|nr:hypothetical protein [Gemmataceae bacterium]